MSFARKFSALFLFLLFFSVDARLKLGDELGAIEDVLGDGAEFYKDEAHVEFEKTQHDEPGCPKFPQKQEMKFNLGDVEGRFQVKYRPESFFGENIHRLNSNLDADRVIFSRHILDSNFGLRYGEAYYGHIAAEFFTTFRIKAVWGSPGSIVTTEEQVKIVDVITGGHSHFVKLEVPRFREIWFSLNLNEGLGLCLENQHYFKIGTFPFELGRGISLGYAYAVNSGLLGFYSDAIIDQFAPGYLFTGEIIKDTLSYDLYGGMLENFSDTFKNTLAKVRAQEIGRKSTPSRGFGRVDYVVAGRLRWIPYDNDEHYASFEPYALFNHAPEQKIEFNGDAGSDLGTFGLAAEFRKGNFEFGFDTSFNRGGQKVRGWDKNALKLENRVAAGNTPRLVEVNTHVNARLVADPNVVSKAVYVAGSPAQKAIFAAPEDQSQNGQLISNEIFTLDGQEVQLVNAADRFRNAYTNRFNGWMLVTDAAYTFEDARTVVAGMVAVASGDEDPNNEVKDGVYSGFIGLQEIYTGDRVKSVFFLNGVGKVPRLMPAILESTGPDILPSITSNFTDIIVLGGSLKWESECAGHKVTIMPNILDHWLYHATRKFDAKTKKPSAEKASRHLGEELNVFIDFETLPGIKLYGVGSVFIPGQFYKDVKGQPLNEDELAVLDRLDALGIDLDAAPLLSNNVAYTLNFGIEIRF